MTTYKQMTFEGQVNSVLRDGKTVILLGANSPEEQAYLKWLEEGNTPLSADADSTNVSLPAEENQ